ncbi:Tar ligand binding domain-containing protein [Paraburkholderia sp. DGU8]|uniref:Tar ligand binding domain-containing protein n=1 Tax=Paraburkholderia sp. DGU8 TaxID=3161997 RepID=UPI00346728D1
MFKGLTIRAGMTLVIAGFVIILAVGSVAGIVALKLGNDALREMYETDTSALVALKTSDALLQRARVSLNSYHALYGLVDPEPALLDAARLDIRDSDRQFASFLSLQSQYTQSPAATQLKKQRRTVLDNAVLPGLEAFEHMNFGRFKELQGKETQNPRFDSLQHPDEGTPRLLRGEVPPAALPITLVWGTSEGRGQTAQAGHQPHFA